MIHVKAPLSSLRRRLPFYLAMEEWVATSMPADDYFFTWIVDPTVICGRNQDISLEVDLDYCRRNGIDVCRRKSGGGCVYADAGNIMISCITPADSDVPTVFSAYSEKVAAALQAMGLEASSTGRNDVLIGARKVSGGAFYHIPNRSIMHSTMLYTTDMTHMKQAITPSKAKLQSKKVQSVEARITTISEHLPEMSIDEFRAALIRSLASGEISLGEQQIREIDKIEQAYYEPRWLYGRHGAQPDSNQLQRKKMEFRLDGVGTLSVAVALDSGFIAEATLSGDFFALADVDNLLLTRIRGLKADQSAIESTLAGIEVEKIVAGLSAKRLADCLTLTCKS